MDTILLQAFETFVDICMSFIQKLLFRIGSIIYGVENVGRRDSRCTYLCKGKNCEKEGEKRTESSLRH